MVTHSGFLQTMIFTVALGQLLSLCRTEWSGKRKKTLLFLKCSGRCADKGNRVLLLSSFYFHSSFDICNGVLAFCMVSFIRF